MERVIHCTSDAQDTDQEGCTQLEQARLPILHAAAVIPALFDTHLGDLRETTPPACPPCTDSDLQRPHSGVNIYKAKVILFQKYFSAYWKIKVTARGRHTPTCGLFRVKSASLCLLSSAHCCDHLHPRPVHAQGQPVKRGMISHPHPTT